MSFTQSTLVADIDSPIQPLVQIESANCISSGTSRPTTLSPKFYFAPKIFTQLAFGFFSKHILHQILFILLKFGFCQISTPSKPGYFGYWDMGSAQCSRHWTLSVDVTEGQASILICVACATSRASDFGQGTWSNALVYTRVSSGTCFRCFMYAIIY